MELKIIEVINNYPDSDFDLISSEKTPLGSFCVLGYYDGINIDLSYNERKETRGEINEWRYKNRVVIPHLCGNGKITSLCIQLAEDDSAKEINKLKQKEKAIWDENNDLPLLTVSFVRTKSDGGLQAFLELINSYDNMIGYCSYEHCEIVVVFRCKEYRDIISTIRNIYNTGNVLKIYSILGVAEKLLKEPDKLKHLLGSERICVRMNASMKEREEVEVFFKELRGKISNEKNKNEIRMQKYDLLGDDDLLIEIDNVILADILPFYASGELLNHRNPLYERAFYNLETRLILKNGTDVDIASPWEKIDLCEKTAEEKKTEKAEELKWILEDITKLNDMYEDPAYKNELALASYISCIIRLLNGLVQVAISDFHRYESRILLKPMKIFVKYFIKQVEETKRIGSNEIQKKIDYLESIEHAVCRVTDIYENVLNGTANTDKQLFLSLPINSSIYELSPKLYAHYSNIILDIQSVFDKENKYAFFLNPTVKMDLQEEVLFDEREEKGKVVIIDIPVRMLDDVEYIPLYMIHEIFHVLTTAERKRKLRSTMTYACLLIQVQERIFSNVRFFSDDEDDLKLKDALFEKWTEECSHHFEELYKNNGWESQAYYGKNISCSLNIYFDSALLNAQKNAKKDMLDEIYRNREQYKEKVSQYNALDTLYLELVKQIERVQNNALYALYNEDVKAYIAGMMYLFKECYADIFMLSITGYQYSKYDDAFLRSAQFELEEKEFNSDSLCVLRKGLVHTVFCNQTDTVTRDGHLSQKGNAEYEKIVKQLELLKTTTDKYIDEKKYGDDVVHKKNNGQVPDKCVTIDENLFKCMVEYLLECKDEIDNTLKGLSEADSKLLEQLRTKLRYNTGKIIFDS